MNRNKLPYEKFRKEVSYNVTHPELLVGERWVTNVVDISGKGISYETKRVGSIAYTSNGKVANRLYPVFVSTREYDDKMKCIMRERSQSGKR